MEHWLSCTITPGEFSEEFAVTGRQSNGTLFSLFAPESDVPFMALVMNINGDAGS